LFGLINFSMTHMLTIVMQLITVHTLIILHFVNFYKPMFSLKYMDFQNC